jgi:hypothetical protein
MADKQPVTVSSIATSPSDTPITTAITTILNNDYVFAVLVILAFSYGQRAGPKLSPWLVDLFSRDIVRVLFLSLLLVVRFESRPTVALIIAGVFVYILQYIYVEQFSEHFGNMMNEKREKAKAAQKDQREKPSDVPQNTTSWISIIN